MVTYSFQKTVVTLFIEAETLDFAIIMCAEPQQAENLKTYQTPRSEDGRDQHNFVYGLFRNQFELDARSEMQINEKKGHADELHSINCFLGQLKTRRVEQF